MLCLDYRTWLHGCNMYKEKEGTAPILHEAYRLGSGKLGIKIRESSLHPVRGHAHSPII